MNSLSRALLALQLVVTSGVAAAHVPGHDHELDRPPIQLTLAPCVPVREAVLRRVLAIELATTQSATAQSGAMLISIECADSQIWLRATDPSNGNSLMRPIDFGTTDPIIWSRLLGLSIVELISVLRSEPSAPIKTLEPIPEVSPIEPIPVEDPHPKAMPRISRATPRVLGVAALTTFFSNRLLLVGGGLRLGVHHRNRLAWMMDVSAQHGTVGTELGNVTVDLFSVGAALQGDWRWPLVALQFGAGFRGGFTHLSGQPNEPALIQGSAFFAGWGGPMITAGTSLHIARKVVLDAHLEAGYTAFSVSGRVSNSPTVDIGGGWLGGQLGIGFAP